MQLSLSNHNIMEKLECKKLDHMRMNYLYYIFMKCSNQFYNHTFENVIEFYDIVYHDIFAEKIKNHDIKMYIGNITDNSEFNFSFTRSSACKMISWCCDPDIIYDLDILCKKQDSDEYFIVNSNDINYYTVNQPYLFMCANPDDKPYKIGMYSFMLNPMGNDMPFGSVDREYKLKFRNVTNGGAIMFFTHMCDKTKL